MINSFRQNILKKMYNSALIRFSAEFFANEWAWIPFRLLPLEDEKSVLPIVLSKVEGQQKRTIVLYDPLSSFFNPLDFLK